MTAECNNSYTIEKDKVDLTESKQKISRSKFLFLLLFFCFLIQKKPGANFISLASSD